MLRDQLYILFFTVAKVVQGALQITQYFNDQILSPILQPKFPWIE
jgi:hypothetical protein